MAVLHSWGNLRPWTLSGHFHETYMHDLININEALSGLPVQTEFLSFEDVKAGTLEGVDVVINAGRAGTAWSGGDAWHDAKLVTALNAWVAQGGVLIGLNEPSAAPGHGDYFRMARALGAVSYTHLDVYKRQVPTPTIPPASPRESPCRSRSMTAASKTGT